MRLPKIFHADIPNIHHAAFWLAFFSIVSGLLGLFRDRFLAGMFGASRTLDIYYASFRVPDFLYTLLLFFTASTAIIPLFLERNAKDKRAAENFFGTLLLFFTVIMVVCGIAAFIGMPHLSRLLLPGFSEADVTTSTTLARILLLSPLLLGISNIFSGVAQSFRRFFVYALSPVLYNIGIIFGVLVFLPIGGLRGLSWGVALGAFMHMVVQLVAIVGMGVRPRYEHISWVDIKKVVLLSFPRTLGLATTQIAALILTGIASTLHKGSIAIFTLASNLENLPITMVGLSYSVAAFPSLTSFSLANARDHFEEHFSAAFKHILFWTVPFSALLLVLRAQIVRVVLGSGAFSWEDTRLTAASLFLLCLAIVFQSLFMLLVRAFYAEGQSWRPLCINVVSTLISVGSVLWLVQIFSTGSYITSMAGTLLHVSDISDIRVLSLPIGILIGSTVNFVLLCIAFRFVFKWFPIKKSARSVGEIFGASALGAAVAYAGLNILSRMFDLHTLAGVFAQGLFAGIGGLLVIALSLWLMNNRELGEILVSARASFGRFRRPFAPEKLP